MRYRQPRADELYRRAGTLITLTNASPWEKKFGDEIDDIRDTAKEEFSMTARVINHRAEEAGTDTQHDTMDSRRQRKISSTWVGRENTVPFGDSPLQVQGDLPLLNWLSRAMIIGNVRVLHM